MQDRNTVVANHVPVMLQEVLQRTAPSPSKSLLDCTFGRGGHSTAFLAHGARVSAIDRDPQAFKVGLNIESTCRRFHIRWSLFSEMLRHYPERSFDAVFFDLGLSSPQIACEENGMSFMVDAPLKMVMGRNSTTAYEIVNFASEKMIEDLIFRLGEEAVASKIAKAIVVYRKSRLINTTFDLARIVRSVAPRRGKDPATQTFQAIRMHVNNELGELANGLHHAARACKIGGVMVVISFHSLEDRMVKNFFKQFRYRSRAIMPSYDEIRTNRRARSAKMRWALVT